MLAALPGMPRAGSVHDGAPHYAVAYSGGLDSTVLLFALCRVPEVGHVRALHVDHGLHADSRAWAQHCRATCEQLGVPYVDLNVTVDARAGIGLEAAARRARYAALAEALDDGEYLLTAHHADDQLETVMLRLLRGAGVRGLRGILPDTQLFQARVVRPMLALTRAEVRAVAEQWRLEWLEDPSNRSVDFDRNLLREKVMPLVRERWGASAAHAAGRLTGAMRDAEEVLDDVGRQDLQAAGAEPGRIPLPPLRRLGAARQRNALRVAIRAAGLPMPPAKRLDALRGAIGAAPRDTGHCVEWSGAEGRVHRDRLYLSARPVLSPAAAAGGLERTAAREAAAMRVSAGAPWHGPQGRLVLEPIESRFGPGSACGPSDVLGLPESWAREGLDVRFRRGGERIKLPGAAHRRTVKAWLREHGVVPWLRGEIPLLYRDERLVAIADLELDDDACRALPHERRWRVRWLERPPIY